MNIISTGDQARRTALVYSCHVLSFTWSNTKVMPLIVAQLMESFNAELKIALGPLGRFTVISCNVENKPDERSVTFIVHGTD